jgi:modulator of FtsH protease HflC
MNKTLISALAAIAIILIAISQTFFIVDQREQAIVLQLGQPVGDQTKPETLIKGPGLHAKIPLVQEVLYFDRRVLPVDPDPEQVVISSSLVNRTGIGAKTPLPATTETPEADAEDAAAVENATPGPVIENVSGEPIIVDTFARYKINDPLQFLKTLRTTLNATARLKNILNDATRAELGRTTLQELLSSERTAIMDEIRDRVNRKIEQDRLGIEIVDIRIVRADLTSDLRTSTVRRMISELTERATETRAKGEERALEISSTADKERSVILANAQRDAEIIKGQGDKEAIKIYADAFNKDKDFYGFMRSMEAYRNTLADPETQLILSPDSAFFRYFQKSPAP